MHGTPQLRAAALGLSIGMAIEDALEAEIEAVGDSFGRNEAVRRQDMLLVALGLTLVFGIVHSLGRFASHADSDGDDETPLGLEYKKEGMAIELRERSASAGREGSSRARGEPPDGRNATVRARDDAGVLMATEI